MNTKLILQRILLVLVLCLLIFSSANSSVLAQVAGHDGQDLQGAQTSSGTITGTGFVPGGPGFIMVSPFDFHPRSTSDVCTYYGSGILNADPSEECNMVTGLTLPHGATLTKMTLYYRDYSTQDSLEVYLFRGDRVTEVIPMANIETSGSENAFRYFSVTVITDPVIDNQMYSYYLLVHFPPNGSSNLILANLRLDYDYPAYLPTVMK